MVGMFWRRRSRPGCGVRWANRKGEHTGLVNVTGGVPVVTSRCDLGRLT